MENVSVFLGLEEFVSLIYFVTVLGLGFGGDNFFSHFWVGVPFSTKSASFDKSRPKPLIFIIFGMKRNSCFIKMICIPIPYIDLLSISNIFSCFEHDSVIIIIARKSGIIVSK